MFKIKREGNKLKLPVLPQAIPYQGSKRKLVDNILESFPKREIDTLWEPFCGSGAVSLNALNRGKVGSLRMSDKLEPLMNLWSSIVAEPDELASKYELIWHEQHKGDANEFYNLIRNQYNQDGDPAKLLYLICRCVANAIRFNDRQEFNQSPDKRRFGKKPEKLRKEINLYSVLLENRSVVGTQDYYDLLDQFQTDDLVYLDPPYQGTSGSSNNRYAYQLDFERFVDSLNYLNERDISYIVSFDGMLGEKKYGSELSDYVELEKKEIIVGRSSQATFLGKDEITIESLYLSPAVLR